MMNNHVGIMQGRLSQPDGGKIQSFPVNSWADEFARAREAGLVSIEWIYETGTDVANPLRTDEGIARMRQLIQQTGTQVYSICADYYMNELLLTADGQIRREVFEHLRWLIGRAGLLKMRYIVLPFVDSSAIKSDIQLKGLKQLLSELFPDLERAGVEIHLETDLKPNILAALYGELDHPLLRANYDIGNSASLGYEPDEELKAIGKWLGSVHVKDRVRGGGTVPLGKGNAKFDICFKHFAAAGYKNPYILQVAREADISETDLAKRNRTLVERYCQSSI